MGRTIISFAFKDTEVCDLPLAQRCHPTDGRRSEVIVRMRLRGGTQAAVPLYVQSVLRKGQGRYRGNAGIALYSRQVLSAGASIDFAATICSAFRASVPIS